MHVRIGDKACEMAVVDVDKYMELAARLRRRFLSDRNIWLSTEMQASVNPTVEMQILASVSFFNVFLFLQLD
jgi:hypothetical protein